MIFSAQTRSILKWEFLFSIFPSEKLSQYCKILQQTKIPSGIYLTFCNTIFYSSQDITFYYSIIKASQDNLLCTNYYAK